MLANGWTSLAWNVDIKGHEHWRSRNRLAHSGPSARKSTGSGTALLVFVYEKTDDLYDTHRDPRHDGYRVRRIRSDRRLPDDEGLA